MLQARRILDAGAIGREPCILVADEQTGGIGRHGRPWSSPLGGLWMTLLWPCQSVAPLPETLSLQIGLAVRRTIARILGEQSEDLGARTSSVKLKWPNDIFVADRKLAGILIETLRPPPSDAPPWLSIGIGINVNNAAASLGLDLVNTSTSLLNLTGERIDLDIFRKRLSAAIMAPLVRPAMTSDAVAEAEAYLWGKGRHVNVSRPDGSKVSGIIRGLSPSGQLLLDTAEGPVTLASASDYTA